MTIDIDPLDKIMELAAERTATSPQELRDGVGFDLTEDGLARAFTARHRDNLRFCHHAVKWFVWEQTHWRCEESRLAFDWARDICRELVGSAEQRDRTKLAKAAVAGAIERFAQADRAFAVTARVWDADPWLLGTPGGTVDLRTGCMREAAREDYITKLTLVAPAPCGTAHPIWSQFLDEATGGDAELQAFLQRLAGYFLTGRVTEEILAFLYGEGGTGKGTFLGIVVAILHDYAVSVPIEVFTAGTRLNLEYYRAEMAGARLVTASETEAGASWAESQIKEMSGNEAPLSGRKPYGQLFNFKPQFKIVLVGNHAPRLKTRSSAMERRMRITPFKHKPAIVDQSLKERLRDEAAAVLRWMIDGCLRWQQEGLGSCSAVMAETGNYFEQQDYFGRWIAERCIVGGPVNERPSHLLTDFLAWTKENGEASVTSSEFRELVERTPGLRYVRTDGKQWVRGIGLRPAQHRQSYSADGNE